MIGRGALAEAWQSTSTDSSRRWRDGRYSLALRVGRSFLSAMRGPVIGRMTYWSRVVFALIIVAPIAAAQPTAPAAVFRPVITELRTRVQIPVLLPSKLPAVLRSRDLTDVRLVNATADNYSLDLHYQGAGGNAGFAAFFSGAKARSEDGSTRHRIRLSNGAFVAFRPVSCGGSCAPANLWWDQGGVQYLIQIVLPATTPPRTQVKVLVETANAMIPLQTATKPSGLR